MNDDFDADACIEEMRKEIEWQLEQWRKEVRDEMMGTSKLMMG